MTKKFVERRHGSFYLIGSRVSLAIIIHEFKNGEPPEAIRSHYPTLSLEQVYGAITFYLGNMEEAEKDLVERRRIEDEFIKTHQPLWNANRSWNAHARKCCRGEVSAMVRFLPAPRSHQPLVSSRRLR